MVTAKRFPQFGFLDEVVGLFPKLDFAEIAIVPSISDDAMLSGKGSGEVGGLGGAGQGRDDGCDRLEDGTVGLGFDGRSV